MKYTILVLGMICLFGCGFEGGTFEPMQEDFDKIRLDHLLSINALIQEYKNSTGTYPFETHSNQLPVIVVIQTEKQKETHQGNVPLFLDLESRISDGKLPTQPERIDSHIVQEFEELLSQGLKRTIILPKDHQKVPVNKPSVYIYTYYIGVYDVTAFLHHDLSFTRALGPFNYKITVGNRSVPDAGIWTANELMQSEEFKEFFFSPFNKPGYKLQTQ